MAIPQKPALARTFFGRRKSHALSTRQERLLYDLLPGLAIECPADGGAQLDPEAFFEETKAAHWLEIGFGKGEHLAWQAERHSQVGLIGCEPYVNGVVGLLTRIAEQGLTNIRIYPDEAQPLLAALPPQCLERVFLLHPDPWPKRRHQGRRFVSQANLDQLARVMASGAELRIGSDAPQFIDWTKAQMAKRNDFLLAFDSTDDSADDETPVDWPATRYQIKAQGQGRTATRLIYRRV